MAVNVIGDLFFGEHTEGTVCAKMNSLLWNIGSAWTDASSPARRVTYIGPESFEHLFARLCVRLSIQSHYCGTLGS